MTENFDVHRESSVAKHSLVFSCVIFNVLLYCFARMIFMRRSKGGISLPALNLETENEYGEGDRHAWALYGFDMVIEPYRETTIRVVRDSVPESAQHSSMQFHWFLVRADRKGTPVEDAEPIIDSRRGFHAKVELEEASKFYALVVQQVFEDGTVAAEGRATVACKYVRRELRDLTEADRTAFFESMRVFYTISVDDGFQKYGPTFSNYQRLVAYHNSRAFCYHNGMHFLTAHAAFNLVVERSLQLINPRVSLASWDFMIDAEKFGTDWPSSKIFGPDMFGSALGKAENSYQISDGWFANVSSVVDADGNNFESWIDTNHNPYGYVTASFNYQDLPGVTRTHSYCGMKGEAQFAKCDLFIKCFEETESIGDWAVCMETKVHASMHGMIGGGFNCNMDMESFIQDHPEFSRGLLTFTLEYILANKWPSNGLYGVVNTCDKSCERGQTEPCGCTCGMDIDSMDDDEVYNFMKSVMKTLKNRYGGQIYIHEDLNSTNPLGFMQDGERLDDELTYMLMRVLIHIGCEPGAIGAMCGGASPSDPLFWVIHPIMEKGLHIIELAPDFRDSYNFDWVNGTCDGSRIYDTVPFTEQMLGFGNSTKLLRNHEMAALLHPGNGKLSYMYNSFRTWGMCSEWDPCPQCWGTSQSEDAIPATPVETTAFQSATDSSSHSNDDRR